MSKYIAYAMVLALLSTAGCDATGAQTVGLRGGTLVSEDGRFSIDIPPGALSRPIDVTIAEVDCSDLDSIAPCYAVGPRGTAFSFPAVVTYELGGADVERINPETIVLVVANESGWNPLADRHVDKQDELVSASAVYLSEFALVRDF